MPRPPLTLGTWGEITAKQVGPGRWEARARYRDIDGVTRPMMRTGRNKSSAVDALKQAMRDRVAPVSDGDVTADTRLTAVIDEWWNEFRTAKNHPAGTLRRYREVLEGHIRPALGEWRLNECSVSKLDRFIKHKTEHVGYSTASICLVLLRGTFDLAVRHDALPTNPMRSVATVPKPEHEVTFFTLDDVAELRAILWEWDHGLDRSGRQRVSDLADPADMFLATGARPGEIFALEWPSIDLASTPSRALLGATMAKNESGKWHLQRRRKNGREIWVRLPQFATEMLMRRRLDATTSLVFPSSAGTPRIPDNFRTQWHAALKGTRFEGRLPKEFRSTVATHLREEVGIEAAQRQLDHAHLSTTEVRYAARAAEAPDVSAALQKFVKPLHRQEG